MQKWLANYERVRHSKQPNESWVSSKYPIQDMHWTELQHLYLPELKMDWGQAVSALKYSVTYLRGPDKYNNHIN